MPLTIFDGAAGPPGYKIPEQADVTVVMYKGGEVRASRALKKDALSKETIQAIAADTRKILE